MTTKGREKIHKKVQKEGNTKTVPAKIVQPIQQGEMLRYWSTGGGGYGPPTERDPELVFEDVIDGRVSLEAARDIYGVIVENGKLNLMETKVRRTTLSVSDV